jgi:hypothetical protein
MLGGFALRSGGFDPTLEGFTLLTHAWGLCPTLRGFTLLTHARGL